MDVPTSHKLFGKYFIDVGTNKIMQFRSLANLYHNDPKQRIAIIIMADCGDYNNPNFAGDRPENFAIPVNVFKHQFRFIPDADINNLIIQAEKEKHVKIMF